MNYIGIDNGVTGAYAIITDKNIVVNKIPTFKCLEYTKKIQTVTRINTKELREILNQYIPAICYIERPMVNPHRFKATKSALMSLEATRIVLEELNIPYKFIDSKEWQKKLLPNGVKKEQLKFASLEVVRQKFGLNITNNNLSDAVLIAEYCRINESRK